MAEPILLFITVLAGILLLGTLGELVFRKTGVPDALWLVLAGILLGPVFHVVDVQGITSLGALAPLFAPIALIVILFSGGCKLRFRDVIDSISSSTLVAVVVFVLSMVATVVVTDALSFAGFLPGWSKLHGLMVGAILGGTSAIVVLPSLPHLKGVQPKLKSMLSLESALSDVLVIVLVLSLINIQLQPASEPLAAIASSLAATFSIGLVVGSLLSLVWVKLLPSLPALQDYRYSLTFAVLLGLYALVEFLGGSGAIAVLAFGIVYGNRATVFSVLSPEQPTGISNSVDPFHDKISFFVKTFFFVLIGLLFTLEPLFLGVGLLIALALFVVRWLVVRFILRASDFSHIERQTVIFSFPRGLAAAVMAILPASLGIPGTESFQAIVFAVILFTILIFTLGMVHLNYFPLREETTHATAGQQEHAKARRAKE